MRDLIKRPSHIYWGDNDNLLTSTIIDHLKHSNFNFSIKCFSNGKELVDAVKKNVPQAVILDINLPLIDGLSAAREIKKINPEVKIATISIHNQAVYISSAMAIPVDAYLVKGEVRFEDFIKAIELVNSGGSYFSDSIKAFALEELKNKRNPTNLKEEIRLNLTEKKILLQLAKGMTTEEVEGTLGINKHTIVAYKKCLFKKFEALNTTHLIIRALKKKLITLDMIQDSCF